MSVTFKCSIRLLLKPDTQTIKDRNIALIPFIHTLIRSSEHSSQHPCQKSRLIIMTFFTILRCTTQLICELDHITTGLHLSTFYIFLGFIMDIKKLFTCSSILAPALAVAISAAPSHAATFNLDNSIPTGTYSIQDLSQSGKIRANRFLVKYKENATQDLINSTLAAFNIENTTKLFKGFANLNIDTSNLAKWHIIELNKAENMQNAFAELLKNPNIESVTPDIYIKANLAPNDLNQQLWGLSNAGQEAQKWAWNEETQSYDKFFEAGTAGVDISAEEAWDIKTDSSDVVVAVIDSGIDYNHEDLANNMWVNPGEIADNGIDDDGNGYIDDIHGYNFVVGNGNPMDDYGHGTHCAGTIAAEGNNGVGVTGVSWNARLMAVKILDQNGGGYLSDIAEGIIYATNMGAKVSNNSYGTFFTDGELFGRSQYIPIAEAFEAANEAGMVAVISAGNAKTDLDDLTDIDGELSGNYPADLEISNIISVAATDADDQLAPFSNYGFASVDIAAPGVGIYSTMPGNEYGLMSGTSMAGPHVAGAAALVLAKNPELKPAEVKAILMQTGDAVAAMEDITVSGNRLNLAAALSYMSDEQVEQCDSFTSTLSAHETAGRAYSESETTGQTCWGTFCWGGTTTTTYYAQGSSEELGSLATTSVTLYETSPGYFSTQQGTCAGGTNLPPVIEMNGDESIYMAVGTTYQEAGAVATDREDGDISANITTAGYVDTNTIGNYPITYEVADSKGTPAVKVTRIVHVREDDGAPHIQLAIDDKSSAGGEGFTKIEKGSSWTELGYFAWDLVDGDLTSQVSAPTLDTSVDGFNAMEYKVTDSQGNSTSAYRIIAVLDQNKPFIMSSINPMDRSSFSSADVVEYTVDLQETNCGSFYVTSMPVDLVDGVNGSITREGEVNVCEAGVYTINLSITDTDGYSDTQTIRVTVQGEDSGTCVTAVNSEHVTANRANLKYNILVYANGSNDYLGMNTDTTSLEETQPGHWTKVTACE